MSQIVHITFEKLTGLKGEIEGWFTCNPDEIDTRLPLVFQNYHKELMYFYFSHNGKSIIINMPASEPYLVVLNFLQHLEYGTNLLIKSWSYGGGVTINSQPPN